MHIVTTIAGSDSGGGAGIQADLKTFQELEVFGTSVITALTAQNTTGVTGVFPIDISFVEKQFQALVEDFPIAAMKTGMLYSSGIIQAIARMIGELNIPLIVDPVMIAKGGESLLQQEAIEALRSSLLPLATIVTPNIPEAEALTGRTIRHFEDMKQVAQSFLQLGVQCVIVKGGHLAEPLYAIDYVFFKNGQSFSMQSPRIQTKNTHGTGCTFSAALTAFLGRGLAMEEAIIEAKKFIQLAIMHDLAIGNGHGPTNHFAYQQHKEACEVIIHET
ncbi:MAG TPA: bifunctional hydroxymethylpyrimidine kinase/phosphomethylpyrimidine kinase [Lysinibacillus sp.]|jgi:hydroxymethylpyrimidine/phosphomethylpyrimidine kinase|uniref:bifunctional hydroxymethylpyrimidine kinase/phosphomethylpyrimidine kinase n=1 Tax=Lysinibacillus TaxID=400634 RepID=UPI00055F7AA9|nr:MULTISPECIES: bifunctional hydroxymethylpyrimidine kinase/phosphomethylpyrimidine kinase [Lysinibacillus]HBT72242.1 bifunctional hydroxymethylpyrimidine kinase/phosphomethylpyrimidine kinase [Lysinibacillus sp.]WCH46781.1 bifunctional hydroxymethylpyrimidine kinase/phosphomethylpyrimidine kinase [Lysinibacillus sp. OF-1]SCY96207.1 hydroxymethylpyrimidine/phosphomethylpyrimidine kinase [Lysinibacillus sp. SG9]SDB28785.1 hydroxymethylpyrimidine/phosphomethylpyrimidine kinase [Lysinibacillus sp